MPLTNLACQNAKCPQGKPRARLADAQGLYLEVLPNGGRYWRLKYRFGVGKPAIKVMFDTHHVTAMDGDVLSQFRRVRQHVPVVQIADYPNRTEPGAGEIAFTTFFCELLTSGYDGLVELEFMPAQAGKAGEQAMLAALMKINEAL
jgi:sugar phosphate isomerase/epimerase